MPIRIKPDSDFVGDRVIQAYNKANPEKPWRPSIPDPSYTKDGQRKYMREEEYRNFLIASGSVAQRAVMLQGWSANPGEAEKNELSAIFRSSRKAVRDAMFNDGNPISIEAAAAEVAMSRIKYHRNRMRKKPESKQWLTDNGLLNQQARIAEFRRLRAMTRQP